MSHSPRILLFDIETLPNLLEALKRWTQLSNYPGMTMRADINSVAVFGYKFLGEETKAICAWEFDAWAKDVNDDFEFMVEVSKIFEGVDAVVTQNGKSFDWRFLQTRLAIHKLPALPPLHHMDTKNESKSNLFLTSNSLKNQAQTLTDSFKMENEGWDLWVKTYHRDETAMQTMRTYCMQDVNALEALFKVHRKYTRSLPNHNLFTVGGSANLCPNCGSTRLRSDGIRANTTMTYRRYVCLDCGKRSRTDLKDKLPRSI